MLEHKIKYTDDPHSYWNEIPDEKDVDEYLNWLEDGGTKFVSSDAILLIKNYIRSLKVSENK